MPQTPMIWIDNRPFRSDTPSTLPTSIPSWVKSYPADSACPVVVASQTEMNQFLDTVVDNVLSPPRCILGRRTHMNEKMRG